MITKKKLITYKRYDGDLDIWTLTDSNRQDMNSDDWYLIDDLIQDIKILLRGNASSDYAKKVAAKLKESCEDDETVEQLMKIAKSKLQ